MADGVDPRFGERMRELLAASGLTYRALAARSYYSKSHLHDLASGHAKPTPQAASRIDRALIAGGELVDLAAAPPPVPPAAGSVANNSSTGGQTARDRLLRQLIAAGDPPAEAPPTGRQLNQAVTTVHSLYQQARYGESAELLPEALTWAEHLAHRPGARGRAAMRILAIANVAASKIASKVGDASLAWLAADRAAQAARSAGDEPLRALAAYQVACALLKTPERVADARMAIEAALDRADRPQDAPDGIAAVGALHLLGAVVSARQGDAGTAAEHLTAAGQLAGDRDGNALWTAFGTTNVRIHELAVAVALGNTAEAIRIGETIDVDRLPDGLDGRRAQVHIELATAWARTGRADGEAVLHLLEAERIAAATVHMGHAARAVLVDLAGRRGRRAPGLAALAERAGVAT